MSKLLIAIAALGVIAASAMPGFADGSMSAASRADAPGVSCEVRMKRTNDGVQLEALVHATRQAAGEYQLIVTKNGPAGSSDVTQGGEFAVGVGATVLGSTEFGLEARGRLKAHLILSDRNGRLCEHEVES